MAYEAGDKVILTGEIKAWPWLSSMEKFIGEEGIVARNISNRPLCEVRVRGVGGNTLTYYVNEGDIRHAAEPDTFASLEADDVYDV